MTVASDAFADLIEADFAGVTFIRDYLQLHFDVGFLLNAYTPVTVCCGGASATLGENAFANLLVRQIGKVVCGVDLRSREALTIRFEDGSTIAVSLRLEDYSGPEAIHFVRPDHRWLVVRPDCDA
jgi:hypothetical protein